jgi:hypothetical protein
MILLMEGKMKKQIELFATDKTIWVQAVWNSVGIRSREQVIALLAKMGKAVLEGEKAEESKRRRENCNES